MLISYSAVNNCFGTYLMAHFVFILKQCTRSNIAIILTSLGSTPTIHLFKSHQPKPQSAHMLRSKNQSTWCACLCMPCDFSVYEKRPAMCCPASRSPLHTRQLGAQTNPSKDEKHVARTLRVVEWPCGAVKVYYAPSPTHTSTFFPHFPFPPAMLMMAWRGQQATCARRQDVWTNGAPVLYNIAAIMIAPTMILWRGNRAALARGVWIKCVFMCDVCSCFASLHIGSGWE